MSKELTTLRDWSLIWLEDGSRCITRQLNCGQDVKRVVETVAKVLRSKEVLFTTYQHGGRTCVHATRLGRAFFECTQVDTAEIDRQYPKHRFNPMYTIFKRYCPNLWDGGTHIRVSMVDDLNLAVQRIREFGKGAALPKRLANLQRSERANARAARERLVKIRRAYSKVLAIRLDLEYYSKHGPGQGFHAQAVTMEQAQAHRDKFLVCLRRGPFAEHLAGYIWKMEFAFEKGCHFHFAILLDGQKVCKDITIADLLGEQWKAITGRKGMYFNCNRKKEAYAECGIGMLSRGDDVMWGNLERATRYMTKIDYYIRFEVPEGSRTFGSGGPYRDPA
jgi:hypothetical protein